MDAQRKQDGLAPGIAGMENSTSRALSQTEVFDDDTMSYFLSSASTASFPTTTAAPSPSIIGFLLEAAEVQSEFYPPRNWQQLRGLVKTIEADSCFDTLRRNALIFYLLLDHHLLPTVQASTEALGISSIIENTRIPILNQYCTNRLLPRFWRDSIEKGFWRFDKGYYAEAMPWLNIDNSRPYSRHILMTLDPSRDSSQSSADGSVDSSKIRADCVALYLRLNDPPLAMHVGEEDASKVFQTLRVVVISKALAEGLNSAFEFVRSLQPNTQSRGLLSELWTWLFNYHGATRPGLLKTLVSMPLTQSETASLQDFALATGLHTTSAAAPLQALDTLLVRLLNQGQVLEALRINKLAERSQLGAHGLDGSEAAALDVKRRKRRNEMLRLAEDLLPEALKCQLACLSVSSDKAGYPTAVVDEQMPLHSPGSGSELTDSLAAHPRADPDLSCPLRGYMLDHDATQAAKQGIIADGSMSVERAVAKLASGRKSISLTSQSPFAGAVRVRPIPLASRVSSSAAKSSRKLNFYSNRTQTATPAEPKNEGPYARFAAQLMAQSKEQALTESHQANGNYGQDVTKSHGEDDSGSSFLLSSILPAERKISRGGSGRIQRDKSGAMRGEATEATTNNTEADQSKSGFEVPKRRYVASKKDKEFDDALKGPSRSKRPKNASSSTSVRPLRSTKTHSVLSPSAYDEEGDPQKDVGQTSADFQVASSVARARFASSVTTGDVAGSRKVDGAPRRSQPNPDQDFTSHPERLTRSQSIQSQSIPGSWPGEGDETEHAGRDETDAAAFRPEIMEISSDERQSVTFSKVSKSAATKSRAPTKRKTSIATVDPLSSIPLRRSRRGSSAASSIEAPHRRFTRSQSAASSRVDEGDEDDVDVQNQVRHEDVTFSSDHFKTRASATSSSARGGARSRQVGDDDRRMTRSMSVLSQLSSQAGDDRGDGPNVGFDSEKDRQEQEQEDGGVESDETPKEHITRTRTKAKRRTTMRSKRK